MQPTSVVSITDVQMEALWIFISHHRAIKHDLAKKLLIWLTMQTELMTRPVKISIRKNHYGVEEFSGIVQNAVHDIGSSGSGAANIDLFCAAMGIKLRFGHVQFSGGSEVWISENHLYSEEIPLELPTNHFLDTKVHIQQWFIGGRRSY